MNYKVSVASNSYSVKKVSSPKFKVSAIIGSGTTVANLSDLNDVNISGIQDGYVLVYNSATGKYVASNPDNVLSNAVTGGLPNDLINSLDTALDDKIDLDGGGF